MGILRTQHLNLAYEDKLIIQDLDLYIPAGKITALVGRNGCGKSTILKALARLLRPQSGHVYLDGKAIREMLTKEVAKQLAILPQSPIAPDELTVEGLVRLGRYPHQNLLGKRDPEDDLMVEWALSVTDLKLLRNRALRALSGGQRQRAWIAMALAQGTDLLLLDEPTTYLDMAHQLEVLELLDQLNREQGKTVVMVIHDLNHAARYADHMVAICDGRIAAQGSPKEIITPELLKQVFGVKAHIYKEPGTGVPICIPYELQSKQTG
jgi:ABC-type cobalamin/Fe3+-siderophores transport system ATPase subunit